MLVIVEDRRPQKAKLRPHWNHDFPHLRVSCLVTAKLEDTTPLAWVGSYYNAGCKTVRKYATGFLRCAAAIQEGKVRLFRNLTALLPEVHTLEIQAVIRFRPEERFNASDFPPKLILGIVAISR